MARQQSVEVPELKNIDEAISWIMSNVGYVQKKSAKNLNYTFAGEAALIQAVRPWMVLAGVTMHVNEIRNKVRETYETT
jgi:ABC-type proline/glycine betaine transport system permease subunit